MTVGVTAAPTPTVVMGMVTLGSRARVAQAANAKELSMASIKQHTAEQDGKGVFEGLPC